MEPQENAVTPSNKKVCADSVSSYFCASTLIEEIEFYDDDDDNNYDNNEDVNDDDNDGNDENEANNLKPTNFISSKIIFKDNIVESTKKQQIISKEIKLSNKRSAEDIFKENKLINKFPCDVTSNNKNPRVISFDTSIKDSALFLSALQGTKDETSVEISSSSSSSENIADKVIFVNTPSNYTLTPILPNNTIINSVSSVFGNSILENETNSLTKLPLIAPKTSVPSLATIQHSNFTAVDIDSELKNVSTVCTSKMNFKKNLNDFVISDVHSVKGELPVLENPTNLNQMNVSIFKNSSVGNVRDTPKQSVKSSNELYLCKKAKIPALSLSLNSEKTENAKSKHSDPTLFVQNKSETVSKNCEISSGLASSNISVKSKIPAKKFESVAEKPNVIIAKCLHPTCVAYSQRVEQKLKTRLEEHNRKVKALRMAKFRQIKRIDQLQEAITTLEKQKTKRNTYDLLPDGLLKQFLGKYLKQVKNVKTKSRSSTEMREFAIKLHSISPKAYEYVRCIFDEILPSSSSVDDWYNCADDKEL